MHRRIAGTFAVAAVLVGVVGCGGASPSRPAAQRLHLPEQEIRRADAICDRLQATIGTVLSESTQKVQRGSLTPRQAHKRFVVKLHDAQVLAFDTLIGLPSPAKLKTRFVAYIDALHAKLFRALEDIQESPTLVPTRYGEQPYPPSARLARTLGLRHCT